MGREQGKARTGEPSIEAALGVVEPFLNAAARNILHAGLPEARDGLDPPTAKQLKADQLADLLPPSLWPGGRAGGAGAGPGLGGGRRRAGRLDEPGGRRPRAGPLVSGRACCRPANSPCWRGTRGRGSRFWPLDWAARVSRGRAFPPSGIEGGAE